ncbi:MAG: tetratricopeptide repeat protein, partial [Planctomycetota bacterium]
ELALAEKVPLNQSVAELRSVIRERADFHPAWKGLGLIYRRNGDPERAAEALTRCVELRPGVPEAVYELALIRANQNRAPEVLRLLEPLLLEYPDFVSAHYLCGTVLGQTGRFQEAAAHLKAVFNLDPDHESCLKNMVAAFTQAGQVAELKSVLEGHLQKAPESARVRQALAVLLATCPDPSVQNVAEAVRLLEPFTTGEAADPSLMLILGSLYFGAGQLDAAHSLASRARDLAEQAGKEELVAALDRLLERVRLAADVLPEK